MNRWFPHPTREALLGLCAALAGLCAACSPNNSVKAGAPVLTELIITQQNPQYDLDVVLKGGSQMPPVLGTTVLASTPMCPGSLSDGDTCDPAMDSLCFQIASSIWCSCGGTWSCAPLGGTTSVIAIFDRVLDTTPFGTDAGDTNLATIGTGAGAPTAMLVTDYTPNGSTTGLIFPLLGKYVVGNLRVDGPSVLAAPIPEFPAGTVVTVAFDRARLQAKDGKTAITGTGPLQDPTIAFATAPFGVSITVPPPEPPPPPPDGGADAGNDDGGIDAAATDDAGSADAGPPPPRPSAPDKAAITAVFTSFVPGDITTHVHVTVNGVALVADTDFAVATDLGSVFTDRALVLAVTPTAKWPASSTVVITIDKDAKNLLDQALGTDVSASFMTAAM